MSPTDAADVRSLARPLKKAHLLRWPASPLAAAYLQYAWTQLRWVPRLRRSALHLALFEQPRGEDLLQCHCRTEAGTATALRPSR
jgi:hypothetical protein